VERIKRWVIDKDREDRRKNIIIKGIKIPRKVENDRKKNINWVTDLIKEKCVKGSGMQQQLGCGEYSDCLPSISSGLN